MRLLPPADTSPVVRERPPGLSLVLVYDAGGFVLNELAAGAYALTANKRGYVTGGRKSAFGWPSAPSGTMWSRSC